ncbi:hypothetical protein [Vibrio vulnificus YJ016]|uniref:Uncharacterized protein n=1 Tax=Vibrio vulnificus (strain YJ016) TaxID=196600 RepID=Q7ML79_VIBVY|nr:hypothetical protein [Vibrio vulnificus YJ016]
MAADIEILLSKNESGVFSRNQSRKANSKKAALAAFAQFYRGLCFQPGE